MVRGPAGTATIPACVALAALVATLARTAVAAPAREPTGPLEIVPPARDPGGPPAATPVEPAAPPDDLSPEPGPPPAPDLSPGPAPPKPAPERPHRLSRLPSYIGLGAGVGLTTRSVGEVADLRAVTGFGAVHGRIAGYAQRKTRGKTLMMLLPELQLDLELGGTASTPPAGRGVMVGAAGIFAIGGAFASPGRVGVYVHVNAAQRFRARLHDDLEGAHYLATPGLTAGLRVNLEGLLTLLIGGGADGEIGAQRLVDRARLVAQLAPVGQLALFGGPRGVYVGVVGRAGATVLGERYGGSRVHGRATAEVMWRVARPGRIGLVTVLLTYEGTRIAAAPGHPQFDPRGERRTSHQLLLAGGFTF